MKIVHIAQYFNPGYGYQENILPFYQQKLGHDVVLLTSTRGSGFLKDRVFPAGESTEMGVRIRRLEIAWELKDKFVCFRNLMVALEAEKPDYIFHHMPTALSIRTAAAYKQRHPHVFLALDNHADLSISINNKVLLFLYYSFFWRSFLKIYDKAVDLYFGVTPARCLFLQEMLGVKQQKVRLLPIGADTRDEAIPSCRVAVAKQFSLDQQKIWLIHGGKMTSDKQVDRLLEAFSRIANDQLCLLLFGSVEDVKVKTLIAADPRIHQLGWLNRRETLDVLAASDLGIWNTRHTTLLEDALAMGLPMILRYYGSTCHLIDHSGLFLYEGTVDEIRARIEDLVSQPEQLAVCRREASRLRDELSYSKIAEESIRYCTDQAPQPIHRKFMSSEFCRPEAPQFRKLSL